MLSTNLSLTEQIIVNPVLGLRVAPLNTPEDSLMFPGGVTQFFQSEILTRIIAIATSVFAAIDCVVQLTTGIVNRKA